MKKKGLKKFILISGCLISVHAFADQCPATNAIQFVQQGNSVSVVPPNGYTFDQELSGELTQIPASVNLQQVVIAGTFVTVDHDITISATKNVGCIYYTATPKSYFHLSKNDSAGKTYILLNPKTLRPQVWFARTDGKIDDAICTITDYVSTKDCTF